jgi:hypothetical protein
MILSNFEFAHDRLQKSIPISGYALTGSDKKGGHWRPP